MLKIAILLLVAHFVGDFLCQTDWMALNKSKDNLALTAHAWVYTFWMMMGVLLLNTHTKAALLFFAITYITHWWTDYFTSRWTSKLWFVVPAGGEGSGWFTYRSGSYRHWFFVVIGLDQLIHFVTLALTWRFIS